VPSSASASTPSWRPILIRPLQDAAIRFARAARGADVAVFYYSGHAMQYAGVNYLVPIDAELRDEADLRRMARVDEILADLQQAKNLRILVLDSCRDNPLADDLKRSIGLTRGASIGRGLARMESLDGTIISYSTQAGGTAEDGEGRNSPYTTAFLKHIADKEDIATVFRRISANVIETSNGTQRPELSLSFFGEFYLNGKLELTVRPPVDPCTAAESHWKSAEAIGSIATFEDHLARFPNCAFIGLAKARIESLTRIAPPPAAPSITLDHGKAQGQGVPPAQPQAPAAPVVNRPANIAVAVPPVVSVAPPSRSTRRVALVIGNSAYRNVARLPNPAKDAAAIADMFRKAGFDSVQLLTDLGDLDFKRAIRRFEDTTAGADIAVVFYTGHGMELNGTNYVIPIDARLAVDRDARDEAIELGSLIESVESSKRLGLVILDACRDNPFLKTMKRQREAFRSTPRGGLADPRNESGQQHMLIAYAAKEGSIADDGYGEHSPFTTAILKNLTAPGLDIRLAFGRIRDEVLKATNNQQGPFVYGSMGGGVVSLVPATSQPRLSSEDEVKKDYEIVMAAFEATKHSRVPLEVFLKGHPTGIYADLVREQLNKLVAGDKQ
jgi:uncharacterized caspase-like protein